MGLKEDSDIALHFPKYLSECQEGGKQSLDVTTDSEVSDSQYMSEIEKYTFKYFKNSENDERNISDGICDEEGGGTASESNTQYKMESSNIESDFSNVQSTQLETVKECEEEHKSESCNPVNTKRPRFTKHRINKFKGYSNFNNRESTMNDVASFSWDFHAYDLFSKFLPELTDAIQN